MAEVAHLIGKSVKDKHNVVEGFIQAVSDAGVIYTKTPHSRDFKFCNYVYLLEYCTSSVPLGILKSE